MGRLGKVNFGYVDSLVIMHKYLYVKRRGFEHVEEEVDFGRIVHIDLYKARFTLKQI